MQCRRLTILANRAAKVYVTIFRVFLEGLEKEPVNKPLFTMEEFTTYRYTPSDKINVTPRIKLQTELKIHIPKEINTPFHGELRVGKSEYEEFLEVVSGSLGDNLRTNYVLQAIS